MYRRWGGLLLLFYLIAAALVVSIGMRNHMRPLLILGYTALVLNVILFCFCFVSPVAQQKFLRDTLLILVAVALVYVVFVFLVAASKTIPALLFMSLGLALHSLWLHPRARKLKQQGQR